MKLYRIQTGKVRIKNNEVTRKKGAMPKFGKLISDWQWTDWLPIYSWVLDHPEGIILVDTGETYRTGNTNFLPKWHPYYALAVKYDVQMDDEIGHKLSQLGINQFKDITKVIMTHLHPDQAGGLYHFPAAEIIISKKEYEFACGWRGLMRGYLTKKWPTWLNPTLIDFGHSKHGPFNESFSITKDRRVVAVSTPGHTPGHMSVIAEIDGYHYFLAGDASYNQRNMLNLQPDGVGNKVQSIKTLRKIKLFSAFNPTIYLPSHDPETPLRMDNHLLVTHYIKSLAFLETL